jgi:hypothetical protein
MRNVVSHSFMLLGARIRSCVIIRLHRKPIPQCTLRHLEAGFAGTTGHSKRFYQSIGTVTEEQMTLPAKFLTAAALLIAAVSTASAQTYWSYGAYAPWSYGNYGPRANGYYGTPYGGGPQYGSGGGDQYGYGPGYSYARQAPQRYPWR